jgi:hypothetical protein
MTELVYSDRDPAELGVYACRVPSGALGPGFWDDVFLIWDGQQWCRPRTDQPYRGRPYWIGPLPRKMP